MVKKAALLTILLLLVSFSCWAGEVTQERVQVALHAYLEKHAPVGTEMVDWKFPGVLR